MGSMNFIRLEGRAALSRVNNLVVAALIMLGITIGAGLAGLVLMWYNYYLAVVPILAVGLFIYTIRFLKTACEARKQVDKTLYPSDDKQYVWDIEKEKDQLLARMLQEHICPWHDKKCPLSKVDSCKCLKAIPSLIELGMDPTQKEKIKLNEP